jgi:hypothetical protein
MTVYEFIQLLCFADDQKICVWDCDTDKNLYQGTASDLDFEVTLEDGRKVEDLEVSSIDNIYPTSVDEQGDIVITLNVCTEGL